MESNKDEAIRCLAIAQRHRDAGSIQSARKFCEKSISLFSTPEALKLLASINSTFDASATASASAAAGVKQRRATTDTNGVGTASGIGGEKREYSPEQKEVVQRVRACKVTEYYEILALQRDCDDADVKKAYRKVCVDMPGAGPC